MLENRAATGLILVKDAAQYSIIEARSEEYLHANHLKDAGRGPALTR